MVTDSANITVALKQEVSYLISNDDTANFAHRDLDLYLQGHKMLENI